MWIIYAIFSALFYACATMFAKYSFSKVVRDQRGLVVVHAFAALILIGILWLIKGHIGLLGQKDVILALISGGLIGFAAIFYFKAFYMEDASVVTLLTQIIVPLTLLAGVVVLHDAVKPLQLIAAAIILAGITISTWSRKGFHLNSTKVIPIILIATTLTTAVLIISKSVLDHNDVISYTFFQTIGYFVCGVLLTAIHQPTLKGFKKNIKPFHTRMLLVVGASEVLFLLAILLQFKAFTLINAGLVVSVGASEVFLSILIGYMLTKLLPHIISETIDKKTILRKIIAGIMVVSGIVLLNFTS